MLALPHALVMVVLPQYSLGALLSGGLDVAQKTGGLLGGLFQARLLASRNSPVLCALISWPDHLRKSRLCALRCAPPALR